MDISIEEQVKRTFPTFTGKRVPYSWLMRRKFPRTLSELEDWASSLIEWSEDARNRRLPSFASQLRFDWHQMYEWDEWDTKRAWRNAMATAKDNIGRHREESVGKEGGIHQAVYNKTAHAFDDFTYEHSIKERKALLEAQGGSPNIQVVIPELMPRDE